MTDPHTIARSLSPAHQCPECDGNGWIAVEVPRCCGRSEWECGGRGCTGPEPDQEQEQCALCQGTGLSVRAIIEEEGL